MDPSVKHVMLAEAPLALNLLSFSTTPAAKKDMPRTKSLEYLRCKRASPR